MSTASTAIKVKSRMTEMTSSQPILLSWGGAACSQFHLMQIAQHQDCADSVVFGLAIVVRPWFVHVDLVSALSQEDVVDGAEGGGRDKARRL